MILPRMRRAILAATACLGVVLGTAACGTQRIHVPKSDPTYAADHGAAELFAQRCAGCHTLSYAGTHGSGANPRTYEAINGPNFNVRCERPAIRVLYAIENGGFSGAYMPPNIFVGAQARAVAMFVSRYAGRQAPFQPGVVACAKQPIGTLPSASSATQVASAGVNPSAGNPAKTKPTKTAKNAKAGSNRTNVKAKAKGKKK
jgi:mono/diheme cytochrome c family protein